MGAAAPQRLVRKSPTRGSAVFSRRFGPSCAASHSSMGYPRPGARVRGGSPSRELVRDRRRHPQGSATCPASTACAPWRLIAVVLFHSTLGIAPGGFLGVEVFFVISGYIITRALLAEREEHGANRARALLAAPRTAAVAGTVPIAGGRGCLQHALRGERSSRPAPRHRGRAHLRHELGSDRRGRDLLRLVGALLAAPASLVAGSGGAVLPGVAVIDRGRAGGVAETAHLRADRGGRGCLRARDGGDVRARRLDGAHLLRGRIRAPRGS